MKDFQKDIEQIQNKLESFYSDNYEYSDRRFENILKDIDALTKQLIALCKIYYDSEYDADLIYDEMFDIAMLSDAALEQDDKDTAYYFLEIINEKANKFAN